MLADGPADDTELLAGMFRLMMGVELRCGRVMPTYDCAASTFSVAFWGIIFNKSSTVVFLRGYRSYDKTENEVYG